MARGDRGESAAALKGTVLAWRYGDGRQRARAATDEAADPGSRQPMLGSTAPRAGQGRSVGVRPRCGSWQALRPMGQ